jgi:hypothetical protein
MTTINIECSAELRSGIGSIHEMYLGVDSKVKPAARAVLSGTIGHIANWLLTHEPVTSVEQGLNGL